MIKCGLCGSSFYRRTNAQFTVKWVCCEHLKGKERCSVKAVSEDEIYQAFLTIYNKLLLNKDSILHTMLRQLQEVQEKVLYRSPDMMEISQKISSLVKQNHALTRLQTKGCMDSAVFIERSNRNHKKIEELRLQLRRLEKPDGISEAIKSTESLVFQLKDGSPLLEFDPVRFKNTVANITVYPEKFQFQLINGLVFNKWRNQC